MSCAKKRPSSVERAGDKDNSRIFTPSQASRSFSLCVVPAASRAARRG
jgi:hypothetical protein